ncbi:sensor histidine kinase [Variovorax sp. VaC1]|uniref:sensor histidine kinase n=1 Tax=Variovorax sp. VaC1 TaxID=3373132 RepID=UPI003749FEE7
MLVENGAALRPRRTREERRAVTQALVRRWKRWVQPSLVRRLLLAQICVVALLWGLTVALFLYDSNSVPELVRYGKVYDLILSTAQNLADAPDRQQETLRTLDLTLLETSGDFGSTSDKAPIMQVWQEGVLIYNSNAGMPVMLNSAPGQVETIRVGDREWRARTMTSPLLDTRVMLAEPKIWRFNFTIENRSYYLLPLVISLPFLVFPAWLSVLLALRPWRQVTQETAARGPADLTPLSFEPKHKELRPLVRSINDLLRSVRDRAARERGLIADAANELRTPLDAMRVNVEALKEQTDDAGQRELMANLLRSNDRASRLVGQLQQLMRSDEIPQDALPTVLALDGLVQDRISLVEGLAGARGVVLDFSSEGATPVFGERESLISMISNLVENAIKYSPDGGTVTVRIAREGRSAVLRVTDQGPGIPPALRERVFDRFFRNPDQTQSGSGLGLAIVKSVLEQHKGRIELDVNPKGNGLQVTVWLPLSTA